MNLVFHISEDGSEIELKTRCWCMMILCSTEIKDYRHRIFPDTAPLKSIMISAFSEAEAQNIVVAIKYCGSLDSSMHG